MSVPTGTSVISASFCNIVSSSSGGAVRHASTSPLCVLDCSFVAVSVVGGKRGGAVYCEDGKCTIKRACFCCCRSDIMSNDDGGNCVYTSGSIIDFQYLSVIFCAQQKENPGDCPLMSFGDLYMIVEKSNFSQNFGNSDHGDGLGEIYSNSTGFLRECVVENCTAHRFTYVLYGTTVNCNIVNNNLKYLIFSGGTTKNCYVFNNVISEGLNVGAGKVTSCYSDDSKVDPNKHEFTLANIAYSYEKPKCFRYQSVRKNIISKKTLLIPFVSCYLCAGNKR